MQTIQAVTNVIYRTGFVFAVCILLLVPVVSSLEANDTEDLDPAVNVSDNSTILEIVPLTSQTVIDTEESNRLTNISNDTIIQGKETEDSHDANDTKELNPAVSYPSNLTSQETQLEETSNNTSNSEIQLMNNAQSTLETDSEKILPSQLSFKIDPTGKYVEGQVIIRYKPGIMNNKKQQMQIQSNLNDQVHPRQIVNILHKNLDGVQLITLPSDTSVERAISIYQKDPNILWAQPNYIYYPARVPNDPMFNEQWGFNNTGQSVNGQPGGTFDADIDLSEAWDTFSGPVGSDDVLIAVIDSGIDFNHPDFENNIWTNAGEMGTDTLGRDKRSNGIDDDGNGMTDDWHGWNVIERNGNVTDEDGHGTVCAGTIGATGNNAIGISGVDWRVKIIPVKVTAQGYQLWATDYWIMQGLSRAYDNGARIFSISWVSGGQGDGYVNDFIQEYNDALFICAAGNIDEHYPQPNNDITPLYPANYIYGNVISVAASDENDNLSAFSHYGIISVDLAAPGENIVLPHMGGGYEYTGGTSIAAPMVAGVAGLIKAINPSATPIQIKNAILNNVDTKSSLTGKVNTSGRLNAKKALDSVSVMVPPIPDFTADVTSGQDPLTVHFADNSAGARINTWTWNFGDGGSSYLPNPTHTYNAGTYTVSLTLNNGYSNTTTKTNYITVSALPSVFYIVPSFNSAQGSIIPSSIQSVQYGSSLAFNITPNTGYQINDVIVSGVSQGAIPNYTFMNVQANSTISATFTPLNSAPITNFTATPTSGTAPLTVHFTDTSTNSPANWSWDFGDGDLTNATIQNPIHTYTSAGAYTVNLTATNAGGSDYERKMDYIAVTSPSSNVPVANFTGTPTYGTAPLTVWFTDMSTGNNLNRVVNGGFETGNLSGWTKVSDKQGYASAEVVTSWTQGGVTKVPHNGSYMSRVWIGGPEPGTCFVNISGDANLTNINSISFFYNYFGDFEVYGTYKAKMYVGNDLVWQTSTSNGNSWDQLVINTSAYSGVQKITFGTATTDVSLGDSTLLLDDISAIGSDGITTWSWDFGDGNATNASVRNPVHTYTSAGTYTVNLTVSNASGSNTSTRMNYITVTTPTAMPVANFTATPRSGIAPLTVRFTDASTNAPMNWSWNFGDGDATNSTVQNPLHTYATAGNYSVNLTVTNVGGSNTSMRTNYITVMPSSTALPVANFTITPKYGHAPLTVRFTDESTSEELVTNGGFETGNLNGWTKVTDGNPYDYAGVTHLHNLYGAIVYPHSGSYMAIVGLEGPEPGTGSVNISQEIDLTSIDSLSFFYQYYGHFDSGGTYDTKMYIGNSTVWQTSTTNAGNWEKVTIDTSMYSGLQTIAFRTSATNAYMGGSVLLLDDVSMNGNNGITSWTWDFGDGNTTNATVQSPVHTYTSSGAYSVNLTVTNAAGIDYERKTGCIVVSSNSTPTNLIVNGGFETGDLSGWNTWANDDAVYSENSWNPHNGSYTAYTESLEWGESSFSQVINLTTVDEIRFWSIKGDGAGSVKIDSTTVLSNINDGNTWTEHVIDTSSYTGNHTLEFYFSGEHVVWFFDDVSAMGIS